MRVRKNNHRLQSAIQNMSHYWFARVILEKNFLESRAFADGRPIEDARLTNLCGVRASKRRRYRALKAQGFTPSQAKARMDGISVVQYEEQARQRSRQRIRRWGGQPCNVGSPAWQRWMLRNILE